MRPLLQVMPWRKDNWPLLQDEEKVELVQLWRLLVGSSIERWRLERHASSSEKEKERDGRRRRWSATSAAGGNAMEWTADDDDDAW